MTANQSGETHPLDGAFITTESLGGADPTTRKATFKIAFTGEGCIERAHAVEDYLKALVAADQSGEGRILEAIAHNLCSLHDFDPEFVKGQERFARAVITEYIRASPSPAAGSGEADTETERRRKMAVMKTLMHPPAPSADGHDAGVVEHMVQRFLSWKLPENFNPDNGIGFKPTFNDHMDPPMRCEPSGTNLFDYAQAKAMVLHMLGESGR